MIDAMPSPSRGSSAMSAAKKNVSSVQQCSRRRTTVPPRTKRCCAWRAGSIKRTAATGNIAHMVAREHSRMLDKPYAQQALTGLIVLTVSAFLIFLGWLTAEQRHGLPGIILWFCFYGLPAAILLR